PLASRATSGLESAEARSAKAEACPPSPYAPRGHGAFAPLPTLQLNAACHSQLERLVGRRVKQLLRLEQARRKSLAVVMAQERLERFAVRLEAVGPEILAHQVPRLPHPPPPDPHPHLRPP